jgi:hypothetical protein
MVACGVYEASFSAGVSRWIIHEFSTVKRVSQQVEISLAFFVGGMLLVAAEKVAPKTRRG